MKATKAARRKTAAKKAKKLRGYTPGPWRVSEGRCTTVIAHDGYKVCGTADEPFVSEQWEKNNAAGRWEHFATREENTTERSDEEQDANARLIAASPLLYETLRNLIQALQANGHWDDAMEAACKLGADSELFAASVLIDQIDNDLL